MGGLRLGGPPEAVARFARSEGEGLEGNLVGGGLGADDFGSGDRATAVAADEDGVTEQVGVQQAELTVAGD